MTEETQQALAQAEDVAAKADAVATAQKQACVDGIADGLEARLDSFAKRVAHDQREVTRSLGEEGVRALRADLRVAARQLGDGLRQEVGRIAWPEGSEYGSATPNAIHSALFKHMYGSRTDAVAAVFQKHGYDIHEDQNPRYRSQGLVLPQNLYDQKEFAPLAQALNDLGSAQSRLAAAKAADDASIVDDLWKD